MMEQNDCSEKLFAIFSFTAEGTVDIVPLTWCSSENHCYWPPHRQNNEITKLVKELSKPEIDWVLYDGKIIYKTSDYSRAREKLNKSEFTSDIGSEIEPSKYRKRRPIQKYSPSEETQSSDGDETIISEKKRKTIKGRKPIILPKPPPVPLQQLQSAKSLVIMSGNDVSPKKTKEKTDPINSKPHNVTTPTSSNETTTSISENTTLTGADTQSNKSVENITSKNNCETGDSLQNEAECDSPNQLTSSESESSDSENSVLLHKATSNNLSKSNKSNAVDVSLKQNLKTSSSDKSYMLKTNSSKVRRAETLMKKNSTQKKQMGKKDITPYSPLKKRKSKSFKDSSPTKDRRFRATSPSTERKQRKSLKNLSPIYHPSEDAVLNSSNSRRQTFLHPTSGHYESSQVEESQKEFSPISHSSEGVMLNSSRRNSCTTLGSRPSHMDIVNNVRNLESEFMNRNIRNSHCSNKDFSKEERDEMFQKKVIFMLTDLNTKVDFLLKTSQETSPRNSTEAKDIEGFPKLPISTLEDLRSAEIVLENEEFKKQAINNFSIYGGKKISDCCKRLFDKVLAHELVLKFNWVGSQDKYPFSELEMKNVLVGAIQMNFKGVKEFLIEAAIKKYIRGAPDRKGGREKRGKKNAREEFHETDDD